MWCFLSQAARPPLRTLWAQPPPKCWFLPPFGRPLDWSDGAGCWMTAKTLVLAVGVHMMAALHLALLRATVCQVVLLGGQYFLLHKRPPPPKARYSCQTPWGWRAKGLERVTLTSMVLYPEIDFGVLAPSNTREARPLWSLMVFLWIVPSLYQNLAFTPHVWSIVERL